MRIRLPFAAIFVFILLLASGGGLLPHSVLPSAPTQVAPYIPPQSDKFLHFVTFFALTTAFYFILDTSRRRVIHITVITVTFGLGLGSEVVQGLLPNDRVFDLLDVIANVVGSLAALGLCGLYHQRSNERRRRARYEGVGGEEELDVELGGIPRRDDNGQETGIISTASHTIEDELDNWDENAADEWDDNQVDETVGDGGVKTNGDVVPVSPADGKKIAMD